MIAALVTNARPTLPSPTRPYQRACDIDDIVTRGGRVFPVSGDTKTDLEVEATHLFEREAAVGLILRPFRHEADAKAR